MRGGARRNGPAAHGRGESCVTPILPLPVAGLVRGGARGMHLSAWPSFRARTLTLTGVPLMGWFDLQRGSSPPSARGFRQARPPRPDPGVTADDRRRDRRPPHLGGAVWFEHSLLDVPGTGPSFDDIGDSGVRKPLSTGHWPGARDYDRRCQQSKSTIAGLDLERPRPTPESSWAEPHLALDHRAHDPRGDRPSRRPPGHPQELLDGEGLLLRHGREAGHGQFPGLAGAARVGVVPTEATTLAAGLDLDGLEAPPPRARGSDGHQVGRRRR